MNIAKLVESPILSEVPMMRAYELIAHSCFLGLILMSISIWCLRKLKEPQDQEADILFGSSNYLFLTIGMTVVMMLVNNNLARAFAIGAAIGLMRLRIKIDGKGQGTTFFFAALAGMAIGVEQLPIAWLLVTIFGVFQILMTNLVYKVKQKNPVTIVSSVPNLTKSEDSKDQLSVN